jgi:hypothetical protein
MSRDCRGISCAVQPKASFVRVEAVLPNELWQTDATEWRLADSRRVEILNLIDTSRPAHHAP